MVSMNPSKKSFPKLGESDYVFREGKCCLHFISVHVSPSGAPTHPHVVKTASIGTLGRTRTPMVVTVPNAPDVPETSKMLEDVDNVSIAAPTGCL